MFETKLEERLYLATPSYGLAIQTVSYMGRTTTAVLAIALVVMVVALAYEAAIIQRFQEENNQLRELSLAIRLDGLLLASVFSVATLIARLGY